MQAIRTAAILAALIIFAACSPLQPLCSAVTTFVDEPYCRDHLKGLEQQKEKARAKDLTLATTYKRCSTWNRIIS